MPAQIVTRCVRDAGSRAARPLVTKQDRFVWIRRNPPRKAISVRNVARRQCVRCCRRHGRRARRRDAGHQVSAAAAHRRAGAPRNASSALDVHATRRGPYRRMRSARRHWRAPHAFARGAGSRAADHSFNRTYRPAEPTAPAAEDDAVTPPSSFDGLPQPQQCLIPLPADRIERRARRIDPRGIEAPAPLAPDFHVVHEPACASTSRCCVTDWRVMSVPAVICAIDSAVPAHSAATIRSRVSSPSAANTSAQSRSCARLSGARAMSGPQRASTWVAMFVICSPQPPSFIRNASARRSIGSLSKPDSTTVSSVPPATSASSNTTSVGVSCA